MSIPYDLTGSKENPVVSERSLTYFKMGLIQLLGGSNEDVNFENLKDKFKYYIVKDEVGYRIVGDENG